MAVFSAGLTWKEAKERCPPGVVPACHNSEDTVTISGPVEGVRQFVAELKSEGYFAKEVSSNGVAFHSHYMSSIAPTLKEALAKVTINLTWVGKSQLQFGNCEIRILFVYFQKIFFFKVLIIIFLFIIFFCFLL